MAPAPMTATFMVRYLHDHVVSGGDPTVVFPVSDLCRDFASGPATALESNSVRWPSAEVDVSANLVRELVRRQHPDLASDDVREMTPGFDNTIWRLGTDLVVRLPRRQLAVSLIESEQRWLPVLAPDFHCPFRHRFASDDQVNSSRGPGRSRNGSRAHRAIWSIRRGPGCGGGQSRRLFSSVAPRRADGRAGE